MSANFINTFDNLVFNFDFLLDWFPSNAIEEINLSIHSPNSFPKLNNKFFNTLDINKNYHIRFSQINTELLGSGYDTNCYDYDLDHKYLNYSMRSDCITKCFLNFIRNKCNVSGFFYLSDILLRSEILNRDRPMSFQSNECIEKYLITAEIKCEDKCQLDCKFKYYSYELTNTDLGNFKNFQKFSFYLQHNHLPDIVVQYLPQTTFISFVCYFGGLLGMWLGISFLTILNDSLGLIKRISQNFRINLRKITNNNININSLKLRNTKNTIIIKLY
jgi:hypothetical protein